MRQLYNFFKYINRLSKESYDLELARRDSLKMIDQSINNKNTFGHRKRVGHNRTKPLLSTKTARRPAPRAKPVIPKLPTKPTKVPPIPARRQSMNRTPGEVQGISIFGSDNDDEMSNNGSVEEVESRGPCPECGAIDKCLFGCRYGKNKDDNNQCHNCKHVQCICDMYLSWETDSPYVSHVSSSGVSCLCGVYSISCEHHNMDSNGYCFDCKTSPERDAAREAQAFKLNNNNDNIDDNNHNSNNSKEKPLNKSKSNLKNENNNNEIVNTLGFEGENDNINDNDDFMMINDQPNNIGWAVTQDEQVSDVSLKLCDIEVSCHESEMEWPNSFIICTKCCDDHKVCEYDCDWSRGNGKCSKCKSKLKCVIKYHKLSIFLSVFSFLSLIFHFV